MASLARRTTVGKPGREAPGLKQGFARGNVPKNHNRIVLIAHGHESLAVGSKDGAFQLPLVSHKRLDELALSDVPKAGRMVKAARKERFTVRGKADTRKSFG